MAVNWNMGVMPDIGGNALAMFERGREMKREDNTRNALATIFQGGSQSPQGTPTMPGGIGGFGGGTFDTSGKQVTPVQGQPDMDAAWNTLAQSDPRLAMQLRGQHQQQAAQQQQLALKAQEARDEYIANAAYDIVKRPEAERGQAWDNYIAEGAGRFPELAQYRGQYSAERLSSIVAKAGQMPQFQKFQQPDYVPVGEGGLSGFQYGVPIMAGQQAQNFGAPGAGAVAQQPAQANIIPQRPSNMNDDDLWKQAHEAVRNGANADDVFRQLQAWGVNP